jgi:hypothetical protein
MQKSKLQMKPFVLQFLNYAKLLQAKYIMLDTDLS